MIKKKGGLGRGLDALLETREPVAVAGVQTVPVEGLSPNRFQPRTDFNDTGLEELADSIRQQGIVQPVVVTPGPDGGFTIIAGERRWRAARRAGLAEIPVIVKDVDNDRQLLEMALVENLQRADLNAIEEAEAFRSLQQAFGISQEAIGVQVGRSRAAISNALRLLGLPEEIQDMLRDARLTAGQARPLLTITDEEEQLRLALLAVEEGLSARQLEALTRDEKRPRKKRAARGMDADTAAAAERLTRRIQTKVEIRRRGTGGTVQLHFSSEEELMRLYDLLLSIGEAQ
jgi:ParB family chromosome partitioning protein